MKFKHLKDNYSHKRLLIQLSFYLVISILELPQLIALIVLLHWHLAFFMLRFIKGIVMLNLIPTQISKAARQVTLRHPNSFTCDLWRKRVVRTSPDSMGGLPTLGGLGVLDSVDEAEIDYDTLGEGKLLMLEPYQPSSLNDKETTLDMQYPQMLVSIEPIAAPEDSDYFMPDKQDIVFLRIGSNIAIGFEIVDIVSNVNIAPYTRKYVLNKRDDLMYIDGLPR